MSTGQMMLVIGAFSMLSILALSFNRTMWGSMALGLEMQATLNALSIAQSMMDEITSKSYDKATIGGIAIFNLATMTAPNNLGPEGSEAIAGWDSSYTLGGTFYDFKSRSRFNDVDDYHRYMRKVLDPNLGYFEVIDSIAYCSEFVPDRDTTSQTFYKKITVVVKHFSLPKKKESDTTSAPLILKGLSIYRQYF